MEVNPIKLNPINAETLGAAKAKSSSKNALDSFSDVLDNVIENVSGLQKNADMAVEEFVAGKRDIHDVMIEVEKAGVAMQLTTQLRNKILEAYQEVMRMQI